MTPTAVDNQMLNLNQAELEQVLYCMEQMQSDYQEESQDWQDWLSAIRKIESQIDL